METYNMSRYKFKKLSRLPVSSKIFNTEGEMYLIDGKNKWETEKIVLKKFYTTCGPRFSNKLYTINELVDKKDEINMEELVMPSKLASVSDEVVGYTMPYVPNINFQEVLESKSFSHEEKVAYLKEIGAILEKLRKVRKYTSVNDFYLNDVHENNFILNAETGKINVVDLDSAKIGYNLPSASRYLSLFSQLVNVPKYEQSTRSIGGDFEPDENTDIYCYVVMIFNYFYGSNIGKMSLSDFYTYLEYLKNIGVSKEFLDAVETIYSPKDNVNPYELLDAIAPFYGRCHQNTFKLVRKNGQFGL